MITLNSILSETELLDAGGKVHRDQELPRELLVQWIDDYRCVVIRQMQKTNQLLPLSDLLVPIHVELEMADAGICPDLPVGCQILKSKKQIPSGISDTVDGIYEVTNGDGSKKFSRIPAHKRNVFMHAKFTPTEAYFVLNGWLYVITSNQLLSHVFIYLIPADIESAFAHQCAEGQDCTDPWDKRYPITQDMKARIISMIGTDRLGLYKQIPKDVVEDDREQKRGERI